MLFSNWDTRILPTRVVSIWTLHTGWCNCLVARLSSVRVALFDAALYPSPIQATLVQLGQYKEWQRQRINSWTCSCSKCAQSGHIWPTLLDAGAKSDRTTFAWGTYETSILDCSFLANAAIHVFDGDFYTCLKLLFPSDTYMCTFRNVMFKWLLLVTALESLE